MGLGQGIIGGVCIERKAALATAMLGVNQANIFGAPGHQISHVMQDTRARVMAVAPFFASRTTTMFEVATASNDSRLGQILEADNAPRLGPTNIVQVQTQRSPPWPS